MHLYEDLKRWAEKSPRKIFLLWRGEALSYSEAYSRVCEIAASLSPWQGEVLGLRLLRSSLAGALFPWRDDGGGSCRCCFTNT